MKSIQVAIVEDHEIIRNGLAQLISTFEGYEVLFHAPGYEDTVFNVTDRGKVPDLILVDINMSGRSGHDIVEWLTTNLPEVRICALSTFENELSVVKMLKYGARGYLLKSSSCSELKNAMTAIMEKGYYYSDFLTGSLVHAIQRGTPGKYKAHELSEKEIEFLHFACTEMTCKEIAAKMYLSPRTIDGYREKLCEKLQVDTRLGLVLYAIKNKIVLLGES